MTKFMTRIVPSLVTLFVQLSKLRDKFVEYLSWTYVAKVSVTIFMTKIVTNFVTPKALA